MDKIRFTLRKYFTNGILRNFLPLFFAPLALCAKIYNLNAADRGANNILGKLKLVPTNKVTLEFQTFLTGKTLKNT